MKTEVGGGKLPIYAWAPDLEEGARQQARNCAALPVTFHHVAVMADGHQGYGVPIGAVLALENAISPYAVGNDIGCGMALVPTTLSRDDFLAPVPTRSGAPGPAARDDVMGWVQTAVPSGSAAHQHPVSDAELDALLHEAFAAAEEAAGILGARLSTSQSPDASKGQPLERDLFLRRGRTQAGTLGSGNHFIELLDGPDGEVWVMLHSGSRGVGGLLCNNFHRMALRYCDETGHPLPDPGLAWLPLSGGEKWERVGRCYERALRAALGYAEQNRDRMLRTVGEIIERRFPGVMSWDGAVNIHHNDATPEHHFGDEVWVHRKGAVKASAGTPTVIPGSMGTGSYLGRGLGAPDSFSSCSHGAGRRMSRNQARQQLSLEDQLALVTRAGSKVFAANKQDVLDEMPGAYKDLDTVMEHQADLVEAVARFTPLATYKGSEGGRGRRRKGKRGKRGAPEGAPEPEPGWRPEEER